MDANAAAREAARRSDGRFGVQPRSEPEGVSLPPELADDIPFWGNTSEFMAMSQRRRRAQDSTSPDELRELASDPMWKVRAKVAANPHTPQEVVAGFADDAVHRVTLAAVQNPNLTSETALALSHCPAARGQAIKHPSLSPDTLRELSKHGDDPQLRWGISANPNSPTDLLDKYAADVEWKVRLMVATNPNTSADTLKTLMQDKNERVRQEAAANLSGVPLEEPPPAHRRVRRRR